jgi:hypothetical protein
VRGDAGVGLALVAAAALAALALAAQAPARTDCTAGVKTVKGVTYRTFCGSAHSTLHLGGKTYAFAGGSCDSTASAFTINIRTITLPPGKPKYRYFGITVFTRKDGTFTNQAVAWQFPNGKSGSLLHTTIKLAGGRKKGTFSGTTLAGNAKGFGTFSC